MARKPLILAVETSSRIGSVAVAIGQQMLAETAFSAPMRHSAEIFPAIRYLLERFDRKSHEIEQIHVSVGPGSFTGLRIAVTMAKTMHLANAAKVVALDTLDVVAANVIDLTTDSTLGDPTHERIATILDAKRGQFFIAVYERQLRQAKNTTHEPRATNREIWKKTFADSVMTASQFLEKFGGSDKPIWLLGDGLLYHRDKFEAKGIRFLDETYWSPRAGKVHLLGWQKALAGQFADPVTLTPKYLMRPDVTIKRRPAKTAKKGNGVS